MELLKELAVVEARDKRVELLRHVCTLFSLAEQEGLADYQVNVFGEVMCGLLKRAPTPERTSVSERIADSQSAPHDLVMTLAFDEIEVASPVLERSPVLSDDDLVRISQSTAEPHRVAVAKRENLTTRVTDELVSHGERAVMRTVTANATARISKQGYTTIVEHCPEDSELARLLVTRPDVPNEVASEVLPMLGSEERKTLQNMLEGDIEALGALLAKAKSETAERKIEEIKQRLQAKALTRDVQDGVRTLEEVALTLAGEGRPRCFAMVMSAVSGLPETRVFHAILSTSDQLLALLCRASALSYDGFRAVDVMRRKSLRLSETAGMLPREQFEALEEREAQRAIRFASVVSNTETGERSVAG